MKDTQDLKELVQKAAAGVAVGGVTAVVILTNQDVVETFADGQPDCPDHDGASRCLPGTNN